MSTVAPAAPNTSHRGTSWVGSESLSVARGLPPERGYQHPDLALLEARAWAIQTVRSASSRRTPAQERREATPRGRWPPQSFCPHCAGSVRKPCAFIVRSIPRSWPRSNRPIGSCSLQRRGSNLDSTPAGRYEQARWATFPGTAQSTPRVSEAFPSTRAIFSSMIRSQPSS